MRGRGPASRRSASFTITPRHQGRGVATAPMEHLLALPFDEFVLRDIKDTNQTALGLYRKLGFRESGRRPLRFVRRAGFSAYVSMSRTSTEYVCRCRPNADRRRGEFRRPSTV